MISNKRINNLLPLIGILIYLFFSFYEAYFNGLLNRSYVKYLIIGVLVISLLTTKKIVLKKEHIFIFLWVFMYFLSIMYGGLNYITDTYSGTVLLMSIFCIIMSSIDFSKNEQKIIILFVKYLSFSLAFLGLFFTKQYRYLNDRFVLTLFGVQMDPNDYSVYCLIGIVIAMYQLFSTKNNIIKLLINIIICFVNCYVLLSTGSRGAFLSLIICFLLLLLEKFVLNKKQFFVIIACLILLILLFINKILPKLSSLTFDRLFNDNYSDGSGRLILWKNAINLFSNHPIFGAGWGNYYGYNGIFQQVHNTYIAILADIGILGFFFFAYPFISKSTALFKNTNFFPMLFLFSVFVPALFIECTNRRFFWNAILLFLMFPKTSLFLDTQDIQNLANNCEVAYE